MPHGLPLFVSLVDCTHPVFAEISRWPFEEPFVRRILLEDIPQRVAFSDCVIYIYHDRERRIVGFSTLDICREYESLTGGQIHAYIPLIGVHPNHQGKGYGKKIVEHLIREASRRARDGLCHDVLFLDVYESSAVAIKLYGKCGFEKAIDQPLEDEKENKEYFVMAKRVSAAPA